MPPTSRFRLCLPCLALVFLSLTWGYNWVLAKQALGYAPPFAFAAERCVGAAIALFLALKVMGRPIRLAAPGATIAIAMTQVAGFMAFQTWALVEGGAGQDGRADFYHADLDAVDGMDHPGRAHPRWSMVGGRQHAHGPDADHRTVGHAR
jgi:hypothetical protein